MTSENCPANQPEKMDKRRLVLNLLAIPLIFLLFMFLPAGTWMWPKGWAFMGVLLVSITYTGWLLWSVNPEIYAARINAHRGTKSWDKVLYSIIAPNLLAIFVVAALDDGRFHWLPVSWWVCLIGYCLVIFGLAIVTWAQAVNKFFEQTVRIQMDRDHKAIDSGPYAIVRHP